MKRPNILLIYTDQQRWDAMGVNGNDDIQTPNLDRLANEGVN
ncbi:MAG: sulfatase-like hydrolase/transferase, partial [Candidatus Latescibacteria bacterium]|nr:sulfatase-like hydrolase/transferase [Candidatus Latescibacterota bacterium]